jgi:hypothetical protein
VKSIADRERMGRACPKEGMGMDPGWRRFAADVLSPSAVVQTSAMFLLQFLAYQTPDRERMRAADPV